MSGEVRTIFCTTQSTRRRRLPAITGGVKIGGSKHSISTMMVARLEF